MGSGEVAASRRLDHSHLIRLHSNNQWKVQRTGEEKGRDGRTVHRAGQTELMERNGRRWWVEIKKRGGGCGGGQQKGQQESSVEKNNAATFLFPLYFADR